MRFTVRDHRPEDFDTLWKIDQSCFATGIAYSQYELNTYMRRPGAFTLVAAAAGEAGAGSRGDGDGSGGVLKEGLVLGFLVAECRRRRMGHVITIDVRSEARRHRVGSALLDAAELRLRSAECQVARLETAVDNMPALSFYKRRGYNVIQTIPRYYSNGVDALLMEKELPLPVSATVIR